MSLHLFTLQQAVYARLSGDSTLTTTLGAEVHDDVPEGTSFPYVVLGDDTSVEYGTKTLDGASNTITLHVWSQYRGAKQILEIMNRVHDLLHNYSLTVSGANLINLRFEFSDTFRDPDGISRHGVMRLRAVVMNT